MPINPLNLEDAGDQEHKNNPNADNSGGVASNQNQISSGESTTVSGMASGQGGANAGSAPAVGSGNFTNLNKYVEANKDQGQGLGGAVAQGVQKSANTGLSALSGSQKEFNTAQSSVGLNPEDYTVEKAQNIASSVGSNPSEAGNYIDQFNQARAKNTALASGSDSAPKSLTDLNSYQDASSKISDAQNNANLTNTESGRAQLLKDQFKRPDYSAGQNNLDQLLTQNIPENRQRFDTLRQSLLGQYGLASQQNEALQKSVDTRNKNIADTATAAGNIQTGVNNVLTPYEKQLQDLPGKLNAEQAQNVESSKQSVKDYLSKTYGDRPFGLDMDTLVNQIVSSQSGMGGATLQNSINADQASKMQSLNELAGRDPNMLGDKVIANLDPNAFNSAASINTVAGQQALNNQLNTVKAGVQNQFNNFGTQAYGKTISTVDDALATIPQAKDVNNVINGGHFNDHVADQQKIGVSMNTLLNNINKYRSDNGLSDVGPTQKDYDDNYAAYKDQLNTNMLNNVKYSAQRAYDQYGTKKPSDIAMQQLADNFTAAKLNGPEGKLFQSMAWNQATGNILKQIQSNPLFGAQNLDTSLSGLKQS